MKEDSDNETLSTRGKRKATDKPTQPAQRKRQSVATPIDGPIDVTVDEDEEGAQSSLLSLQFARTNYLLYVINYFTLNRSRGRRLA